MARKKKTLEQFIKEANKVHNYKYDYSKCIYIGARKKAVFICPNHGEFEQNAGSHLAGSGCSKCAKNVKKTKEEFIKLANNIHNNKYNYNEFNYINAHTKSIIICPIHGKFWQSANAHTKGKGCAKCYGNVKKTLEQFIKEANSVHNNKYNYSIFKYINYFTKNTIICPIHGEFHQTPANHIKGRGCPECGKIKATNKKKLGLKKFIQESNKKHDHKYNYSKFIYINARIKGIIICPIHGEFKQVPYSHLSGCGCPECFGNNKKTTAEFIKQAKAIHKNKYDYSLVKYNGIDNKVNIICSIHGQFKQTPYHHLKGDGGCKKCKNENLSKKFRKPLKQFIKEANKVHNNKYDYSNFIYKNCDTKGIIICSIHGRFFATPYNHLNNNGCPQCSIGNSVSKNSQLWLDSYKIPQKDREYAIYINNRRFIVDGIDLKTNTIYEFYGDFWHGNPKLFKKEEINPINKVSYGQLYENTLKRENLLKRAGFKIIYIWESDFSCTKTISI